MEGHQTSGARAPDFWCPGTRTLVPPFCCCWGFSYQCMLILSWQCSNITRFCIKHRDNWQTREIHGSEAHSRDQKKNLFVSLERAPDFWCLGTKTLVPGHQNSGAPTSFLLLSYQCTSIHAGNVWRRKKLFLQTLCLCKTLLLCSNFHLNELPLWKLSQRNILIEVLVDKGSTRAVVESSRIILLASTTPARYWGLLVISAPTKLPLLGRHISGAWTPDD